MKLRNFRRNIENARRKYEETKDSFWEGYVEGLTYSHRGAEKNEEKEERHQRLMKIIVTNPFGSDEFDGDFVCGYDVGFSGGKAENIIR